MGNSEKIKVLKTEDQKFKPTRREGVSAARLIGPGDSESQNVVIVELDKDALVEDHEIARCESIYVLQGVADIEFNGKEELLLPGDLVYFPANTSHKLTPRRAPCRLLLIFSG